MNYPKIILIVIIVGLFLFLFGDIIGNTLAEIDFSTFDDPIEIFAEIIDAFIVSIDTAGALFPLTIQTLLLVGGLGIASSTIRRLIKR